MQLTVEIRKWWFAVVCLVSAALLSGIPFTRAEQPAEKKASEQKSEAKSPAKSETKKEEAWQLLFDGKELGGFAETEFGAGGEVLVKDGDLVLSFGDGCTGVTWQDEFPKVDYEVRLQARRVEGIDFFCGMTFPVEDASCSLIVGGWAGSVVGLSAIDGKLAVDNDTKKLMSFKKGQWYDIRLRVTKTHITAWIDDKEIVNQETKGHKFSLHPAVLKSRPFGICSYSTTAALRKIELRKLTEKDLQPADKK